MGRKLPSTFPKMMVGKGGKETFAAQSTKVRYAYQSCNWQIHKTGAKTRKSSNNCRQTCGPTQ
jgi:hypothetical protein